MISALIVAALFAAGPPDPFDELAKCDGPGAEPGRTALEICVPRLARAWVENGLVPIPEARRLQPVPVGYLSTADQTGDPPLLLLDGGVRMLGGIKLRNRARVPITTRVDVVYWDGFSTHAVRGHRKLRLRPGTRLRVRGHSAVELIFGRRTVTMRLEPFLIEED